MLDIKKKNSFEIGRYLFDSVTPWTPVEKKIHPTFKANEVRHTTLDQ